MDSSYSIVGSDLGSDSDQRQRGETPTISGASDSESGWDDRETQNQHESGTKGKIVVVGAGPVGALAAIYAAARGFEVEVYELRNGNDIIYCLSSMNIYAFFYTQVLYFVGSIGVLSLSSWSWLVEKTNQSHLESSQL